MRPCPKAPRDCLLLRMSRRQIISRRKRRQVLLRRIDHCQPLIQLVQRQGGLFRLFAQAMAYAGAHRVEALVDHPLQVNVVALRLRRETLQGARQFGEAVFHVGGAALGLVALLPPPRLRPEGEDHREQQKGKRKPRNGKGKFQQGDGVTADCEHGRGKVHRLLISLIRVLFHFCSRGQPPGVETVTLHAAA